MGGARWALVWAVCVVGVVAVVGVASQTTDDHGLGRLNNLINNNPDELCQYVRCLEPESECSEGSIWKEGAAQFGCCGACVLYRGNQERCSGSYDQGHQSSSSITGTANAATLVDPPEPFIRSLWCEPTYLCGRSRICVMDPNNQGCKKVQSELETYLSSNVYTHQRDDYIWIPSCTPMGYYSPVQCKGPKDGKRCVCVDPDGNRIYGDAWDDELQSESYRTMNCACSRRVWEIEQEGRISTLHCTENGNYEELQCEDGWCYCIDPLTTKTYGMRLPENAIQKLECFNATVMGEQYLRRCESQVVAHRHLIEHMTKKGVVHGPSTRVRCDPDGSYYPVQCEGQSCACYDKYKLTAIVTYIPMKEKDVPSVCQGARDLNWYLQNNIQIDISLETNSGNYTEIQVRGQYAFCVDQDGVRAGPLVRMESADKLGCKAGLNCLGGTTGQCPDVCFGCTDEDYINN